MAWQLEHWSEESGAVSVSEYEEEAKADPLPNDLNSIRFSSAHEAWLGEQLGISAEEVKEL